MEVKDDGKNVKITGAMTIEHAQEVKTFLQELLAKRDDILLDAEGVTEIDLSCLQLFCAMHKSSLRADKTVALKYGRSSVMADILQQAGFVRLKGCGGNEKCLWSEASHE
jgi:anti-anti-sigma regulatory factor